MSTADNNSILVVDGTATDTRALSEMLGREGFRVLVAHDRTSAVEQAREALPLVTLLEADSPGAHGFEVCRALKGTAGTADIPVIFMITSSEDRARGFAAGGADYVSKPLEHQEVLARVRLHAHIRKLRHELAQAGTKSGKALEDPQRLLRENQYLRAELREHSNHREIVGSSAPLRELMRQVAVLSGSEGPVLIHGEAGTGKELLARAIHDRSARRERAFIKLDCSTIAPRMIEGELFGRRNPALPNDAGHDPGRLELADGGTLFLDAVTELPLDTQAKLVRALRDGELELNGGWVGAKVNVRVITAAYGELDSHVATGRLREDLCRHLSAASIRMPTLRERADDIPALAQYFLERAARKLGKALRSVEPETVAALKKLAWPGNIRELQAAIECAAIPASGESLRVDFLSGAGRSIGSESAWKDADTVSGNGGPPIYRLVELERLHFISVLKKTRGVIEGPHGAARLLDLKPSTARFRIKKLGIRREDFDARFASRSPTPES